ncbi:tRNA (adenosine(37)-N6)-threonylcarbamoyltransferase complex ATPase subunit type 1 TsaE [Aeromonas caviae]|uniref:NACHT domain-containing protein n=1 Tax=Aeromonas caviae TaxID=648 RepID=UPI0029D65D9E|nr:tRNA (adenosine(37)-N6)-threonylcarbamoyltransferase complex ATPase subunit type 1 TsaE [Aeromonas caviae]MDX7762018.1 tRNA (adenosine(37)-N6)-threonylcarbamoyltransferase complex ATPase subunit type 1 TsaE [Aeromonas caviae]
MNNKLSKINELTNEVKDFHPILRVLFPRLPDISSVEYKQGPNEKGADFVLIKNDSTLLSEHYIGVICKVGKITQSNAEVDRQVDECILFDRLIDGGKRKIKLNEVWVVTNASISSNAEEKLHEKYSKTNIKFINGERIAQLIDRFYPEFWEIEEFHNEQYYNAVNEKINEISGGVSIFSSLGIDELIEQEIRSEEKKGHKKRPEKLISVIKKERFIYLEGAVGSGKTTIIKQLVSSLKKEAATDTPTFLPLVLHYRDIKQPDFKIQKHITETFSKHHIENARPIVIVDGVDEYLESIEDRIDSFKSIISEVSNIPDSRVIITSRTMNSLEDYSVIDRTFSRFSLMPLTIRQIITFVDKICKNAKVTERLATDIEKTHLFKCIPRTPISALLLAKILSDEVKELPSTMTELYAKYTELTLGRWDTTKGLMSQTEYEIMKNVIIEISRYMMTNGLNRIAISEVEDIYLEYLSKRNINVDESSLFRKILNQSEIISYNKQNNTFQFRHRSFMEYFFAEGIKRDNSAVITQEIYNLYWANSYFFYLGLLRDNEQIITAINNINEIDNKHRILRMFHNGSFFLAAYLTPYETITNGVKASFADAANLFKELLEGRTDTALEVLPPVAALCIFTRCLGNNYSFEYFEKALKKTVHDLPVGSYMDFEIQVEKFFISSILNELGDKNAFNCLVECKNLNPLIALGIAHVTEETGLIDSITERYLKKMHRKRKDSRHLKVYLEMLYDNGINTLNSNNINILEK